MTDDNVKRRMLRPASGPSPAAAAGIGRIWGNAVARVAEDRLALPLESGAAVIGPAAVAPFLAGIPANAMLLRLDGPAGAQGLALVGPDAVAALVEMHTMRRLRPVAPDPRPPTRTDAAIVSPVIDASLAMLTGSADEGLVPNWAAGWKVAAFAPDPRPLGLTMPDIGYQRMTLPLIFGLDRARASDLSLLMPDTGSVAIPPPMADKAPEDWRDRLGRVTMPAPAEVRGVLWRLKMPLGAIALLKPGDSLTIPDEAIDGVRVESSDGGCLAVGRLGQLRGDRAVRLREVAGAEGQFRAPPPDGPGGGLSLSGAGGFGGGAPGHAEGYGLPDIAADGLPDLPPPEPADTGAPAFAFARVEDLPDRID